MPLLWFLSGEQSASKCKAWHGEELKWIMLDLQLQITLYMHGIKWSKKLIRQQLASHVKYTNSKDQIGLEKILIYQTIFLYISDKYKVSIPY